jgi:hypothetical protein
MTLTHEESILVHARVVQCMERETEYVVNVRILNAMWAFAHARMTFDENEKVQHNAHVYSWLGNITFKHVVRYRRCSCMHMAKGQTYHAINLTENLSASESIIRIIKTVVLCFYCSLGAGVVTHACGKCRYRKYLAFAWNCAALFTILASHSHKSFLFKLVCHKQIHIHLFAITITMINYREDCNELGLVTCARND